MRRQAAVFRHPVCRAVISALALAAAAANAQQAPQSGQSNSSDGSNASSGGVLSEIVVTAQKRSEHVEDVPIAITSVSGDTLARAGVNASSQLPQLVPALRIDYAGAFAQPTIRGIGSAAAGNGLSANVATYIDGFYVPSTLSNDFQLLGVTNVSVLKGPQGTLFGRNATGGAILVTTRDPSFQPTGELTASYGRFNHVTVNGYGSTGLTDKLAIDVSAIYERGDGYVRNVVYNDPDWLAFRKVVARSKLLFQPDDDTRITLTYQHTDVSDPTPQSGTLYNGAGLAAVIPGATVAVGPRVSSEDARPAFTLKVDGAYLKMDRDVGFANLISYSQLRYQSVNERADEDRSDIPIFAYSFYYKENSFSQELNLTSKDSGRLSWVAGAYYFHDDDRQTNFLISAGGSPYFPGYLTDQKTSALAGFADATYEVFEKLFLTGGLRYSYEKRDGSYLIQSPAVGAVGGASAEKSFNGVTPRAVIRYELSSRTNVYASFTRGFKSGAFNVSGQDVAHPVDPEKVDAYEVGYKTASSALRFDTSAYYYNYSNLQLASYIAAHSFLRNAARARIYGADANILYSPISTLTLRTGLAYNNAKFTSFPNAPVDVQCLDPVACGPGYGAFLTGLTTDARGKYLARSPVFTGTFGVEYGVDVGAGELVFNADYYRTSRVYFDPANQYSQAPYGILNLRATYHLPGDHVSISLYGTNVTDTVYRSELLSQPPFGPVQTYGEPASYGISLSTKF